MRTHLIAVACLCLVAAGPASQPSVQNSITSAAELAKIIVDARVTSAEDVTKAIYRATASRQSTEIHTSGIPIVVTPRKNGFEVGLIGTEDQSWAGNVRVVVIGTTITGVSDQDASRIRLATPSTPISMVGLLDGFDVKLDDSTNPKSLKITIILAHGTID